VFDFSGKAALITGAGSGIGKATAAYFANCGAGVIAADVNSEALSALGKELDPSGSRIGLCRYDAVDPNDAALPVQATVRKFGRLDYLVVCAGIYEQQRISQLGDQQWRRMMGVNLDAVFYLTRCAVPQMKAGGAIVTTASVAAHQGGTAGNAHYGASKGGLLAYTRGLAREVAPDLRANTVSPGWVDTPMVAATLKNAGPEVIKAIPLQRLARPAEIASVIAFLCSDASSFITGESIIVAGGAYMA
jgi:3-oxoacyl-[acyl-carrier protein] reductase